MSDWKDNSDVFAVVETIYSGVRKNVYANIKNSVFLSLKNTDGQWYSDYSFQTLRVHMLSGTNAK